MKPVVLSFSGSIASGKTTISNKVSNILGWNFASFGGFIKKVAIKRGYNPVSREIMQEIGTELIEWGWIKFCEAVLNDANWVKGEGLIIDGIRHVEGLRTITKIVAPQKTFLIFVRLDEKVRLQRILQKNIPMDKLNSIESHPTEIEVKDILFNKADLIVDGNAPIQFNVDKIINWVENQT